VVKCVTGVNHVTVACCYWGNWCRDHGPNYVVHLRNAVARHLTIPHRFVCFTTHPEKLPDDIEVRPLNVPSFLDILPKMIVYRPDNTLKGRVVVMDLDTVVIDSLDEMFSYDGEFCVREAFKFPGKIGGDMLAFKAGFGKNYIWKVLVENRMWLEKETGGDERLVYQKLLVERAGLKLDFWQHLYPGQVVSFKNHIEVKNSQAPRPGNTVVSFHGHPRPHEKTKLRWVRENWI